MQDTDPGKFSNVNIGTDCPDTGVTAAKHYQYADHVPFEDALFEWIDRDDIGDYSMVYTATTRTFTLHPGGQGSDLSGFGDAHLWHQRRRLLVVAGRGRDRHPSDRPR